MFFTLTGSIYLLILNVAASRKEFLPISKPCNLGDTAENECNRCACTTKGLFECLPKPCADIVIKNITEKISCQPNTVYERNSTVCICKTNGSWPHAKCKTIFRSFYITKKSCKPNSYVLIDCNVCRCGPDGTLDKKHCTNNECNAGLSKNRRFIKQNQVYGSCEAKNWYSLAPCQFCFCVSENKLVCNTGNNYARKLQLGSYNLSVCGKDLIKDAIGLIPDRANALRFGNELENKTISSRSLATTTTASTTTTTTTRSTSKPKSVEDYSRASIELNREINEKKNDDKNVSEEYYSDSEEEKPMDIAREGLSTQLPLPFEDEDNDVSDDVKTHSGDSEIELPKDLNFTSNLHDLKPIEIKPLPIIKNNSANNFLQQFEWKPPKVGTNNLRQLQTDSFNLGDVLKPYLPVVLDKVFQMALRKSMVSVDSHSDCTPGATTVFKCNACFCMKNNKLLCTNNTCT